MIAEVTVDDTLTHIERVAAWPIEALNIGLFALVLFTVWRYLRSIRGDFKHLQEVADVERKEYIASLKVILVETNRLIERNNLIFERIDKHLERLNHA